MTKFIESYATHQLRPPWTSNDSRCWCFIVRLCRDHVEAHLERYFNGSYPQSAPFVWTPLMPTGDQFGLLVVCNQPKILSSSPGGRKDALSHREVYLSLPVHRRSRQHPDAAGKLVWLQPFVLGDSATVLFGSREIWGMDMALAKIALDDKTHPATLHVYVRMDAIKTFSPRSRSELLPCMHLSVPTKGAFTPPDVGQKKDLGKFLDILDRKGGFPIPSAPLETRNKATVELNNLKQFRDVYDFDAAVYRAIVKSESTHAYNSDKIAQYDPSQVKLDFIWSDTMCEVLTTLFGLHKPPGGPTAGDDEWKRDSVRLPVELAYSFTSNVDFRVLENLWVYEPLKVVKPRGGAAPQP